MRTLKTITVMVAVIVAIISVTKCRNLLKEQETAMGEKFHKAFGFYPPDRNHHTPESTIIVETVVAQAEIRLSDHEEHMRELRRSMAVKLPDEKCDLKMWGEACQEWNGLLAELKQTIITAAYFGYVSDHGECSSGYWGGTPMVSKHLAWARENMVEVVTP